MGESARDTAVRALLNRSDGVAKQIGQSADAGRLSQRDAALARELALGCVRRRLTLDAVLRAFLDRPDRRPPPAVGKILRVALYQILYLARVPDFAAVSEAVEQTGRFGHKRQGGFVNAMLRTILRNVSELICGEVPVAADVVPVAPKAYRRVQRAVFPDPAVDQAGYLAAAMSIPDVLARRWIERFGSVSAAMRPAEHANVRAPLIVRVNCRKADVRTAVASIEADGVDALPHSNGRSIVLGRQRRLTELAAFVAGWIQPQDPSATAVVLAAGARAGMKALDLCAAPGTKTTHLAEVMDDSGSITAVDLPEKLQRIEANCRRLALTIVKTLPADQLPQLAAESFDLVLADVPCTNTGVLARRAEARWRFNDERLRKLVKDQEFLLAAGERFVKPGGRLVYSTCSLEPEECGRLVKRFLARQSRLELVSEALGMPAGADDPCRWYDGGYVAIFQVS